MADYSQVHIQVDEKTKEKWQEIVDEMGGDLSSLSEFIRWSVNKEIKRIESEGEEFEVDLGPILDYLIDIQESIGEINSRLDSVERELKEDPGMRELANRLFYLLPSREEIEGWVKNPELSLENYPDSFTVPIVQTDAEGNLQKVDEHEGEEIAKSGLIAAYSRLLDEDEYKIKQAIKMLQEETMHVREIELGSKTRYYREE